MLYKMNMDKDKNKNKKDNVKPDALDGVTSGEYKYGFTSDIDTDIIPHGLSEDVVRFISEKKGEPEWLLEFRLRAYRHWLKLVPPTWAHLDIPDIDFQAISYYAAPKVKERPGSLDEVDPELIATFNKLGIPLEEQKALSGMAVDAVMDSVSVKTTHREKLAELGVIFCSISEAVKDYPDLVRRYLGKVVPYTDNFYAALNSAVFSDGSFVYIPKGVRCPMELSTYFRINAAGTGQFERTLIVADDDSYVSYLEGCTAPMRDENQLHAAIVEIVVEDRAEVKYSTVQNWYAGDAEGRGGVYNFVTKRGLCRGDYSKLSWTQVETGSAITWKYPGCILAGEGAVGEFYSVAVTNNYQQADTGTKMIHLGRNTRSTIVSKGISAGHSQNSYRGLVKVAPDADGCRNYTQCDSLLLSSTCGAHTFPYIDVLNDTAVVEHEATTSKISEEQIFYCNQRGIPTEEAVGLIKAYLKRAYDDGTDTEAREQMLRAAYCAGIAFTQSYVGYVHGVAHSLGGRYGVPHGLANAVILPYFLDRYGKSCEKRLARLARACTVAPKDAEDHTAAQTFISWVREMNRSMNIPDKIDGIKEEDIPQMAAHADKESNPLYPVPCLMDVKELASMYKLISSTETAFPKENERSGQQWKSALS